MAKLEVTIVHALPGRVRLRLSHPPADTGRFNGHVLGHTGLRSVDYTPATRSVLIYFDEGDVNREEVVLRASAALSLEYKLARVRVLQPHSPPVTAPAAFYAAVLIGAAGSARLLGARPALGTRLDKLAALGTVGAVLDHAASEVRERGYFDPEVLTLAYLFTAFMQGNLLRASALTWFLTFGRHLLETPPLGVEIQLRELGRQAHGEIQYEIVVVGEPVPDRVRVLGALQEVLREAVADPHGQGANLVRGLHEVSRSHRNVVDGLGSMRHGIPMRFE